MSIIKGVVIKGRQLGRTINFPTANVALDLAAQSIASGVYISRFKIDGAHDEGADDEGAHDDVWFDSITNIGSNPTVNGLLKRSESYIFDFSEDLYGREVTIELGEKLRDEMRFESVEALQQQIQLDVARARRER